MFVSEFLPFQILVLVMALPALVGVILLLAYLRSARGGDDRLVLLAALLTLKPIVATPIWLFILNLSAYPLPSLPLAVLLSLLPGVGLTAVILVLFRPMFMEPGRTPPRILLALDCVRWLNSFFALVLSVGSSNIGVAIYCILPMAYFGMVLPSIFALVAAVLVIRARGRVRAEESAVSLG